MKRNLSKKQIEVLTMLRDKGRQHQGGRGDHFRYRALHKKRLVCEEWGDYSCGWFWLITSAGRKALDESYND